jgi:lambda repressor-like predicted transcriptional regulator
MTPNEIRAELMIKGVRVIDIAANLGIKHPNVSAVIAGKRPTGHIRQAIASAINKSVSEIWPEAASGKK